MGKKIMLLIFLLANIVFYSCVNDRLNSSLRNRQGPADLEDSIPASFRALQEDFNIIVVSDWGWNGYRYQQAVSDQMAKVADELGINFIASCGDNFQLRGVASVRDPLWITNFENVYRGLSLQADWYPVLGNHDYKGNTDAEIEYSGVSRRWRMTNRYYSLTRRINDSVSALFAFIDTPPLISEYHNKPEEYPDIARQDTAKEMKWLEGVLSHSNDKWKLVFGHHPVYSASGKHGNTDAMIKRVKPLLERYNAQFYICGHDHDFQHLHEKGRDTDYIVTGTGGTFRQAETNEMSLFSGSEPGFTVVSFKGDSAKLCFVNVQGEMIYRFGRRCD